MEVKEVIELINKIDDWLTNWQDDADSSNLSIDTLYIIDNICKIKDLIKCGEKYRQIVEDILKLNYVKLLERGDYTNG